MGNNNQEIVLYDYQQKSVNALFHWFKQNKTGNPLLVEPTASGKSIIQAGLIRDIFNKWGKMKILCLTHSKELISQNYQAFRKVVPRTKAGVYSASLGSRDTDDMVIFGGIKSVAKHAERFGYVKLIIIDEAHRVPNKVLTGDYRSFLDKMAEINPNVRTVGLTATPYRDNNQHLVGQKDSFFTDIAHETPLSLMIEREKITPLTTAEIRKREVQKDGKKKKDVFDLVDDMDEEKIIRDALTEAVDIGAKRKFWMAFLPTVAAARIAGEILAEFGVSNRVLHGGLKSTERDKGVEDFKLGKYKCLVSVDAFTTGFDAPNVDYIIFLRRIGALSLWMQMLGRGMRLGKPYFKPNCLVADYGENIERFGAIDQVSIEQGSYDPEKQDDKIKRLNGAPTKTCPICESMMAASSMTCLDCGHEFENETNIVNESSASKGAILSSENEVELFTCIGINYTRHVSRKSGNASIKVSYQYRYRNTTKSVFEWVSIESKGYALKKALWWWQARTDQALPKTVNDAINLIKRGEVALKKPQSISLIKEGQYMRVHSVEF